MGRLHARSAAVVDGVGGDERGADDGEAVAEDPQRARERRRRRHLGAETPRVARIVLVLVSVSAFFALASPPARVAPSPGADFSSPFPFPSLVASSCAPNRPARCAFDRYETADRSKASANVSAIFRVHSSGELGVQLGDHVAEEVIVPSRRGKRRGVLAPVPRRAREPPRDADAIADPQRAVRGDRLGHGGYHRVIRIRRLTRRRSV